MLWQTASHLRHLWHFCQKGNAKNYVLSGEGKPDTTPDHKSSPGLESIFLVGAWLMHVIISKFPTGIPVGIITGTTYIQFFLINLTNTDIGEVTIIVL